MGGNFPKNQAVHLIVGDPTVRQRLIRLLESIPVEVKTFDSVNAFLDAKIVEAPSCLITEVSVDGASAGTLVRDMRNHGLATPVVVLADGEHSLHSAVDAIKAGAADFIEESIGERHFVERIKAIINADK